MARFRLIPRDERFFDLFEGAADLAVSGVETLQALLADTADASRHQTAMTDIEHAADKLYHEAMEKLSRTFVTPLDPEDIRTIANHLDDIIDLTHAAVERIVLYNIQSPTQHARELADVLLLAVTEVRRNVAGLRDMSARKEMHQQCIEINRLENVGDSLYREALATLFRKNDAMEFLRWKDIYDRIENAINQCENLADVIEHTVTKHS